MQDHRSKLDVPGIGTWILDGENREAEFIGKDTYLPTVRSNLWKFFIGGSKSRFADPQHRFVLLEASDEILLPSCIESRTTASGVARSSQLRFRFLSSSTASPSLTLTANSAGHEMTLSWTTSLSRFKTVGYSITPSTTATGLTIFLQEIYCQFSNCNILSIPYSLVPEPIPYFLPAT
jgi:hypothetical protein